MMLRALDKAAETSKGSGEADQPALGLARPCLRGTAETPTDAKSFRKVEGFCSDNLCSQEPPLSISLGELDDLSDNP